MVSVPSISTSSGHGSPSSCLSILPGKKVPGKHLRKINCNKWNITDTRPRPMLQGEEPLPIIDLRTCGEGTSSMVSLPFLAFYVLVRDLAVALSYPSFSPNFSSSNPLPFSIILPILFLSLLFYLHSFSLPQRPINGDECHGKISLLIFYNMQLCVPTHFQHLGYHPALLSYSCALSVYEHVSEVMLIPP